MPRLVCGRGGHLRLLVQCTAFPLGHRVGVVRKQRRQSGACTVLLLCTGWIAIADQSCSSALVRVVWSRAR